MSPSVIFLRQLKVNHSSFMIFLFALTVLTVRIMPTFSPQFLSLPEMALEFLAPFPPGTSPLSQFRKKGHKRMMKMMMTIITVKKLPADF